MLHKNPLQTILRRIFRIECDKKCNNLPDEKRITVVCSQAESRVIDREAPVSHPRYAFSQIDKGKMEEGKAIRHMVSPSETDFNGHMNNRRYVSIAMSVLLPLVKENESIQELHVKYLSESRAGDVLQCRTSNESGRINVFIHKDAGVLACQVETQWSKCI